MIEAGLDQMCARDRGDPSHSMQVCASTSIPALSNDLESASADKRR